MITQLLKNYYADYKPHSNAEVCDYLAKYLHVANTKEFYHLIRGLQQGLKKQGYIRNIGFGIWQA